MRNVKALALVTCVLLAACSSVQPIQQDQPLLLAKGDGLAAVVMNTIDPLTEVFVRPAASGGSSLEIPSVPKGRTLYLFEVKAGNYCFQQFHYGTILFYGRGAEVACFAVPAGQIGYSGDLMPRVINGQVYVRQDYDFESFRTLLQRDYPKIAAQFASAPPSALPTPPTSPSTNSPPALPTVSEKPNCNLQVCSWSENLGGSRSQAIFIKNISQWPIRITALQLYDCVNIKQPCRTKEVSIEIPPHLSKRIFVVDPADPAGAYTYQFRFEYLFDLSGRG